MEFLDLDELEAVTREVTLKSVTYKIADQTVGQMIQALQIAKAASTDPDDPEPILMGLIETAKRLLPDCPIEVIENMSFKQLAALTEFASVSDQEASQEAEVEVTEENLAEKPQP